MDSAAFSDAVGRALAGVARAEALIQRVAGDCGEGVKIAHEQRQDVAEQVERFYGLEDSGGARAFQFSRSFPAWAVESRTATTKAAREAARKAAWLLIAVGVNREKAAAFFERQRAAIEAA